MEFVFILKKEFVSFDPLVPYCVFISSYGDGERE